MPWFPDFVAAAELARRDVRAAGHADPVAEYLTALTEGDVHALETVWPGEVVIEDPRGEIRGHRQVRKFIRHNHALWADRLVATDTVASTQAGDRAVVELLVHLHQDGETVQWPIAVVAESPDDQSVVFRTYCSQIPVDGRRHVRAPILGPGPVHPGDVVDRFQVALATGDVDGIVSTFAPGGYVREPIGADSLHRGASELRAFFTRWFGKGGGIGAQDCAVTDDGVRCAVEYNCVRWGRDQIPPQAGIVVFERGAEGLLSAARIYDDIEPPGERS